MLLWAILALYFGFLGITESLQGENEMVALKVLFFICGLYILFRLFPRTIIYLCREFNGKYEIELSSDRISISPHYGPTYFAALNEIEGLPIHDNLIGCKAISIINSKGRALTFGSLYSEASLAAIKLSIETTIQGSSNKSELSITFAPPSLTP